MEDSRLESLQAGSIAVQPSLFSLISVNGKKIIISLKPHAGGDSYMTNGSRTDSISSTVSP